MRRGKSEAGPLIAASETIKLLRAEVEAIKRAYLESGFLRLSLRERFKTDPCGVIREWRAGSDEFVKQQSEDLQAERARAEALEGALRLAVAQLETVDAQIDIPGDSILPASVCEAVERNLATLRDALAKHGKVK